MHNLVPVKDEESFMKDLFTNVVINVNKKAYEDYVAERNVRVSQKKGLEQCFREIDSIKTNISEIKQLLMNIAQK
jgi:hypothetical protein